MADDIKITEEKKVTDAKNLSKWGMVVTVVVESICNIGYVIIKKDFPSIETQVSISYFAFMFMLPFAPVYLNLFLDKIFGVKK